jgi:hypothetical protein
MRSFARSFLAMILASSLMNFPAMASGEKPLGMVIQATNARLDNMSASLGTTIYAGDSFDTDAGGTLRLKMGAASQVDLLASSAATVTQNANLAHINLIRGTAVFSSPAAEELEIETPAGIVRGADGKAAYGQMTITSANEIVISAYRGNLILDNDGELHTIAEGKAYRVEIEQEPDSTPPIERPYGVHKKRRRRLLFFILFPAAAGLISYEIWRELSESPYKPN